MFRRHPRSQRRSIIVARGKGCVALRNFPVVKGRRAAAESNGLLVRLSERVVGQPNAMTQIVPYVQMYQAGLAPEGRPAGVFLLLGPTGTGKTRTVEALAEVLHGNAEKSAESRLRRVSDGA